ACSMYMPADLSRDDQVMRLQEAKNTLGGHFNGVRLAPALDNLDVWEQRVDFNRDAARMGTVVSIHQQHRPLNGGQEVVRDRKDEAVVEQRVTKGLNRLHAEAGALANQALSPGVPGLRPEGAGIGVI